MLEKLNIKAKNNKLSPNPNVLDIEVFSFNLEYKNITPIKISTKTRFITMVV